MCTRICPDMVIAVDVIDSARRHAYWEELDLDSNDGEDAFNSELEKVVISASGCVGWHDFFKHSGLDHIYLGYGDTEWSAEDYRSYMSSHPEYFKPTGKHPDTFSLNISRMPKKKSDESLDDFLKRCCRRFLTENTYGLQVLKKYGLAI